MSFIILLVLFSGCVDTTLPKVSEPDVKISDPYNINPNTIGMKLDVNISVPIENIRKDEIKLEILQAELIANMKTGSKEYVYGYSETVRLKPNETANISVIFKQVPIIFELKEEPLRLSPVITSYNITVKFKGTVKILKILPYSIKDTYSETINVDELPINKELFTQVLNR